MDPDVLTRAISTNVKRLRDLHDMSQDALAEAADLSKGTVVAIEAQRSNPSVATLCALSEAFGVGIASLLDVPSGPLVKIRRAGEAIRLWQTNNGSHGDLLLGTDPPHAVEVWDWHIEPGDQFAGTAHPRGTVESLRVTSGRTVVQIGPHELSGGAGDTITFEAHEPHVYTTEGNAPTDFTMWIRVAQPSGTSERTGTATH